MASEYCCSGASNDPRTQNTPTHAALLPTPTHFIELIQHFKMTTHNNKNTQSAETTTKKYTYVGIPIKQEWPRGLHATAPHHLLPPNRRTPMTPEKNGGFLSFLVEANPPPTPPLARLATRAHSRKKDEVELRSRFCPQGTTQARNKKREAHQNILKSIFSLHVLLPVTCASQQALLCLASSCTRCLTRWKSECAASLPSLDKQKITVVGVLAGREKRKDNVTTWLAAARRALGSTSRIHPGTRCL